VKGQPYLAAALDETNGGCAIATLAIFEQYLAASRTCRILIVAYYLQGADRRGIFLATIIEIVQVPFNRLFLLLAGFCDPERIGIELRLPVIVDVVTRHARDPGVILRSGTIRLAGRKCNHKDRDGNYQHSAYNTTHKCSLARINWIQETGEV
jgi:hypothetical protein